jgi:hypothetical protein
MEDVLLKNRPFETVILSLTHPNFKNCDFDSSVFLMIFCSDLAMNVFFFHFMNQIHLFMEFLI